MDTANEIIPNLWLGNRNAPLERENMRKCNIKLIINCTKDIEYPVDPNIQFYRLAINDINNEESNDILADKINDLTYLIDLYLNANLGVLIHCYAGVQRSATVVLCYLIKYKQYNIEMAKVMMKNKRSIVFFPYPTFDMFLNNYALYIK
jgi:dual specificity phosphatase 12